MPTLVDLDALAASATIVPSTTLRCDPRTGAVVGGVVPASLAKRARQDAARRHDGYVVPPDMARLVRLRDGRCRFPGCSTHAMFTDQDHVIAWPVGATTPTNLICLCRRHHRIKQRHGWHVRLDPDGTAHWRDPTGRQASTHPVDHLDRALVTTMPTAPSAPPCQPRFEVLGLDDLPSLLEDHLWRHLELLERDGPPPPLTIEWVPAGSDQPPF